MHIDSARRADSRTVRQRPRRCGFLPLRPRRRAYGGLYSVVAYVDGQVAGIGRVVGDGRIAFFIKDLVVLPQYQGNGVGTAVLRALITRIREHCCNHAYIGLMATPGKESFYEEHGFLRRPAPGYGSGLVQFVDPVPLSAAESTATSGIK